MRQRLIVVALLAVAGRAWSWSYIDTVILRTCRETGVPFAIAEAMPGRESSWNPTAFNAATQCEGLYQTRRYLRTWFAKMFLGGRQFAPFNPVDSAQVGIRYLAWLHVRYQGPDDRASWWLALVAYNEGPAAVDKGIYYVAAQEYTTAILEEAGR